MTKLTVLPPGVELLPLLRYLSSRSRVSTTQRSYVTASWVELRCDARPSRVQGSTREQPTGNTRVLPASVTCMSLSARGGETQLLIGFLLVQAHGRFKIKMNLIWVELMLGIQRILTKDKKWYFSYKMLKKIKILFLLGKLSNLYFLMAYNLMKKKKLLLLRDLQFLMGIIMAILFWKIWDYGTQMMKIKKIENKQEFYL